MSQGARKRIGILTGGGDCPGLNAVIRGVAKASIGTHNMEVIGINDGFEGLVDRRVVNLNWMKVSGILTQGGTILGTTNRGDPFHWPVASEGKDIQYADVSDAVIQYTREIGLDALVCIGGDGTMSIAHELNQKGLPIVGVPKTIDNDIVGTDITFGFDSAVATATEAIDKIHSTAMSHHRAMVIEVMGRYAGWLALHAGIGGGGDVILLPELPYDVEAVSRVISNRSKRGRQFSIIVVAEGARAKDGDLVVQETIEGRPDPLRLGGVGQQVAKAVEDQTGIETRVTVLGHLQRGGTPTAFDRVLSTRFGVAAAEAIASNRLDTMVALQGKDIVHIPLNQVGGKSRLIESNEPLLDVAREVGTCLGE